MLAVTRQGDPLLCQLCSFALGIPFLFEFADFFIVKLLLRLCRAVAGHDKRQFPQVPLPCGFQHLHQRFVNAFVNRFAARRLDQIRLIIVWNGILLID